MKVALCISGWARTLNQTVQSYFEHIINPLRKYGHEVDVFGMTYTDDKNKDMYKLLNPVLFCCDPPISVVIDRSQRRAGYAHDTYALWGIQKCNILRQTYEYEKGFQYDWIIRARPDALHYVNIENPNECNNDCIYIPWFNNFKGLNDRFAFGSPRVMDIYSVRTGAYIDMLSRDWNFKEGQLQYYSRYTDETIYCASENFLAQHMVKNNIHMKRTGAMFAVIRDLSERQQDTSLNDFKPGMKGQDWSIKEMDIDDSVLFERYTKGLWD
jgi:hypothetical protein